MAAARFPLLGAIRFSLARIRGRAPWAILCTVLIALSGAAIPAARGQSISFTVQDQSQPSFDTGYPKKTHWVHHLTETHSSSAAHLHFTSALGFSTEKTSASTAATTSRFTATITVTDVSRCGWKLRFSGRRLGHVICGAGAGGAHTELHAMTASLPALNLPEWDTGTQKKHVDIPFTQSSNATLTGTGSQTVTLSFAWDTYVSSDPYYDVNYRKRIGPESYVCLGAEWHPNNGYLLDVELQPCASDQLPSPGASTIPTNLFVAANGSCCFDAIVRDAVSNPIPSAPVVAHFNGCNLTFCPKQDAGVTIDPLGMTATAVTNALGVAHFCVCANFTSPCTATITSDGVTLGSSTVVDCPQTPGLMDGYALADNQYRIEFDTDVTPASATNVSNYALTSLGTVNSAVMDGSAAVILTVSGTGLSHGQSETVTVNNVVSSPDGIAMTSPHNVTFLAGALSVAEIRAPDPDSLAGNPCVDYSQYAGPAGAAGARVTIHGIATAGDSGLYYIQDESGGLRSGIPVFSPSVPLVAGHRYTAAGTVDMELGRPEFSGPAYLRDDGAGTPPTPMKQPLNVLLDPTCDASQSLPTSHDFEGAVVRVDSVLVAEDADSSGDFSVVGPYGVYSYAIWVVNDLANSGLAPVPGQLLRVSGILARGWDRLEIHPRSDADITVLAPCYQPVFLQKWGVFGPDTGQFKYPTGVATDPAGNIYVAEQVNNRIQKFSATGVSLTQWGTLGSGPGQFNRPYGVAADNFGYVYVTDADNHRVEKFTSDGAYVTTWGTSGSGDGQFNTPALVTTDAAGDVYVADYGNQRIQRFTGTGTFVTKWGSLGTGNGQFTFPTGIAVDAAHNVYVSDYNNHRIEKFTDTGTYLTQWGVFGTGNGQFNSPAGVATDCSGNVYVSDLGNQRMEEFSGTGAYLSQWGSFGTGNGEFDTPIGVATDCSGNVYVADSHNHRMQKFGCSSNPVSVGDRPSLLRQSLLIMPNPFASSTQIVMTLARAVNDANVSVLDVCGRLVRTLHRGPLAGRTWQFTWDGSDDGGRQVGSGIYFVRAWSGEASLARKMILLENH